MVALRQEPGLNHLRYKKYDVFILRSSRELSIYYREDINGKCTREELDRMLRTTEMQPHDCTTAFLYVDMYKLAESQLKTYTPRMRILLGGSETDKLESRAETFDPATDLKLQLEASWCYKKVTTLWVDMRVLVGDEIGRSVEVIHPLDLSYEAKFYCKDSLPHNFMVLELLSSGGRELQILTPQEEYKSIECAMEGVRESTNWHRKAYADRLAQQDYVDDATSGSYPGSYPGDAQYTSEGAVGTPESEHTTMEEPQDMAADSFSLGALRQEPGLNHLRYSVFIIDGLKPRYRLRMYYRQDTNGTTSFNDLEKMKADKVWTDTDPASMTAFLFVKSFEQAKSPNYVYKPNLRIWLQAKNADAIGSRASGFGLQDIDPELEEWTYIEADGKRVVDVKNESVLKQFLDGGVGEVVDFGFACIRPIDVKLYCNKSLPNDFMVVELLTSCRSLDIRTPKTTGSDRQYESVQDALSNVTEKGRWKIQHFHDSCGRPEESDEMGLYDLRYTLVAKFLEDKLGLKGSGGGSGVHGQGCHKVVVPNCRAYQLDEDMSYVEEEVAAAQSELSAAWVQECETTTFTLWRTENADQVGNLPWNLQLAHVRAVFQSMQSSKISVDADVTGKFVGCCTDCGHPEPIIREGEVVRGVTWTLVQLASDPC